MRLKWLVELDNVERPAAELYAELAPTIPDLLFAEGLAATGPHRWSCTSDAFGQSWIYLDVEVCPWSDPRRDLDRRATTPEEIS